MIYEQVVAFSVILLYRYGRWGGLHNSFVILLIASYVNLMANSLLGPSDPFLVPIYSSIDALTITALLRFGGVQRGYQSVLLGASAIIHLTCQLDVHYELNLIYDNYIAASGMVTIFQLLGGLVHGVAKRERPDDHGEHKHDIRYFMVRN